MPWTNQAKNSTSFTNQSKTDAWYSQIYKNRVKVTINHTKVGGTLSNFPLYLDLSTFDATFWATVQNGGGDIRITTSDGVTECPREIVTCVVSTKTGEVHVKVPTVSSTTDTVIFVYFGNSTVSDYAANATYGSQNVWTGYLDIYHLTQNVNDSAVAGKNGSLLHVTQVSGSLSFPGEVVIVESLTGNTAQPFGKSTTHQKVAQSFVLTDTLLAHLDVMFRKLANTASPVDAVTIRIQADSGGSPSGSDLLTQSNNWNGTGNPAVGSDVIMYTVTGTTLVVGNTYWIVLTRNGSLSDSAYPNIAYDPTGSSGVLKTYDGAAWNVITGSLRFRVHKSGYVLLSSDITPAIQDAAVSFVLKKTDTTYECVINSTSLTTAHLEVNGQGSGPLAGRLNYRPSSGNQKVNDTNLNTADGNFHWVVMVRDTISVRFYVDGVLAGTSTTDATGTNAFRRFGEVQNRINATYGQALAGLLKSVRFSVASLITANQVLTEYNNQNSPSTFYTPVTHYINQTKNSSSYSNQVKN